ncbi:alpha/beta-hydrolase [Heliocybe sulcata]|uniref:Carboxylic ester hydrolase n=1 Tax=Heliocybe sulcata TaxID=5364 RepID=A0A5C3N7V0_9AGAM|nr:alpha/beta-hydrolase [Heliocybe sulcata]
MGVSVFATLIAAVFSAGGHLSPVAAATPGNVVNTGYASYRGNQTYPNMVAYRGIPYAEPPVGNGRFRTPAPLNTTRVAAAPNGEVVDATEYPDFCIQGTTMMGDAGGAGSEDCLKVNIYAPYGASNTSQLPVLVYFHGGAYVFGNPAAFPFDDWVHQVPDVVIASVYYRLDSFGFLGHPDFADATVGDNNAGFLDQVESLRWINKYISAFGGDPTKVTINGQSAGGSSVELHLVANEGQDLFRSGIAQSVARAPVPPSAVQVDLFDFYSTQAGCGTGSVTEQMACLRNASVSALARAQDACTYNFTGPWNRFMPVIDGKVITDYPTRSILEGNFKNVPIIVGHTSNESLSFGATNITAALKSFFPSLTETDLTEFLAEYPASEFSSTDEQVRTATGEATVRCPRSYMGGTFSTVTNAWVYRYNQRNPTQGTDPSIVEHAAENWMMFQGTNTGINGTYTLTPQTPVEKAFVSELFAYWLSFVRDGDPNTYKLSQSPEWPKYTLDARNRMVLQQDPNNTTTNSGSHVELEPEGDTERCDFVASKEDGLQA